MNNIQSQTEDDEQKYAIVVINSNVKNDSTREDVREEEEELTNQCTGGDVVNVDLFEDVHEDKSKCNENIECRKSIKNVMSSCTLLEETCVDVVTHNVDDNSDWTSNNVASDEGSCEHLRWSPQTPKSVENLASNDGDNDHDEEHEQQEKKEDKEQSTQRALVEEYHTHHNEEEINLRKIETNCDDNSVDNIGNVITSCNSSPDLQSSSMETLKLENESLQVELKSNCTTGNSIENNDEENMSIVSVNQVFSNASLNVTTEDKIENCVPIQHKGNFTHLYSEPAILVKLMEFCSFRIFGSLLLVSKDSYNAFTSDEVWEQVLSIMNLNALLTAHNVPSNYFTFFVHQVITTRAIYGYYEYDATSPDYRNNINDNSKNNSKADKDDSKDEPSEEERSDSNNVNSNNKNFFNYNNYYSIGRNSSCLSEQIKSINLRISAALLGHAWHEVGRVQMLIKFFDGNAELLQGACGFSLCHRFFYFACSSFGASICGPHFDVHVINTVNRNKTNTTLCSIVNTNKTNEKIKIGECVKKCGVNDLDDDDDDDDDNNESDNNYSNMCDINRTDNQTSKTSKLTDELHSRWCDNDTNNSCSQFYLKFTPRWPEPSLADKSQLSATTPLVVQRNMECYQPAFVKPRPLQLCEEDELNSITSRTANRSDVIQTT